MRKIAILVPGIGYTCDRPLLYYTGKLAQNAGYEVIRLGFKHLGGKKNLIGNEKKMKKVFRRAMDQAEEQLDIRTLIQADEVLFISKSVGTAVAAAYQTEHAGDFDASDTEVRHIYFTPVAETFIFMKPESGIAFHGTADPWVADDVVVDGCRDKKVPLYIRDDANHSMETGDVMADLETLQKIMRTAGVFLQRLPVNKIVRIEEADYGCEELPEGKETPVRVILEDESGRQTAVQAADRILRERGIDEGDLVTVGTDGELRKTEGNGPGINCREIKD